MKKLTCLLLALAAYLSLAACAAMWDSGKYF